MRIAEIITAVFLGILSIYLMWKSGDPPVWNTEVGRFANIGFIDGEGPGSGFWPFWLSAVMLVSTIWIGVNWYRRTSPPSQSDEPFLDGYGKRMLVVVGGAIFGFLALIHVVGFYGAIPIFMIYYMKFLGRHTWFLTLMVAVSLTVICFFFFDIAMRIVLPKGYLEPLFIPLYDLFL
jgi:putative tricarboxylic transport membrane protein